MEYLEQKALTERRDLAALQWLTAQVNEETAPTLSGAVATLTGMASLPLPKQCLLDRLVGRTAYAGLVCNLKRELATASELLSQSIRQEVYEKSTSLELAYRQVELAEQTRQSWQQRKDQLQRLADLGDNRAAESADAESSLHAADAAVIQQRLQARLAEVELAEVCGALYCRSCQGYAWLPLRSQPTISLE
jgi:outer membrane protein TolC